METARHCVTRSARAIWLLSPLVLLALLAAVLTSRAIPVGAAPGASRHVTAPPPLSVLASFPASGLPSGPAHVRAVIVHVPAGVHFKHVHGGNVYNYVISGSLQSTDDAGTHTYGAGQFYWEPVGHVHTIVTAQPVTFFSLQVLTPRAIDTLPVP